MLSSSKKKKIVKGEVRLCSLRVSTVEMNLNSLANSLISEYLMDFESNFSWYYFFPSNCFVAYGPTQVFRLSSF